MNYLADVQYILHEFHSLAFSLLGFFVAIWDFPLLNIQLNMFLLSEAPRHLYYYAQMNMTFFFFCQNSKEIHNLKNLLTISKIEKFISVEITNAGLLSQIFLMNCITIHFSTTDNEKKNNFHCKIIPFFLISFFVVRNFDFHDNKINCNAFDVFNFIFFFVELQVRKKFSL